MSRTVGNRDTRQALCRLFGPRYLRRRRRYLKRRSLGESKYRAGFECLLLGNSGGAASFGDAPQALGGKNRSGKLAGWLSSHYFRGHQDVWGFQAYELAYS
jgi:hypothetical protein